VGDGIQFGIALGVRARGFRGVLRGRGRRMTSVHCGSHDRIVPHAPGGDASSERSRQAKSRPHDGPADVQLFQPAGTAAIVQTYCVWKREKSERTQGRRGMKLAFDKILGIRYIGIRV
jgi:hypothetical protein